MKKSRKEQEIILYKFRDGSSLSLCCSGTSCMYNLHRPGQDPFNLFTIKYLKNLCKTKIPEFYVHEDKTNGTGYIILRLKKDDEIHIFSTKQPEKPLKLSRQTLFPSQFHLTKRIHKRPSKLFTVMYCLLTDLKTARNKGYKYAPTILEYLPNLFKQYYAEHEVHDIQQLIQESSRTSNKELLVSIYHGKVRHKRIGIYFGLDPKPLFSSTRTKHGKSLVLLPLQQYARMGIYSSKKRKYLKKLQCFYNSRQPYLQGAIVYFLDRSQTTTPAWNWVASRSFHFFSDTGFDDRVHDVPVEFGSQRSLPEQKLLIPLETDLHRLTSLLKHSWKEFHPIRMMALLPQTSI